MDPVANLKRQRQLAQEILAFEAADDVVRSGALAKIAVLGTELADLIEALDEWLKLGGFDPYTTVGDLRRIHEQTRSEVMTDTDIDIRDVTSNAGEACAPLRVILSLDPAAAEALDDLLTEGRGRPRGQPLSPVEARLRRALRTGVREVRG